MLNLIQAQADDLDELCEFYSDVSSQMHRHGLTQWNWPDYPSRAILAQDIHLGCMYIGRINGKIAAAVAADCRQDSEYSTVNWLFGIRPGVLHRLAIRQEYYGQGLGTQVVSFGISILRNRYHCDALRGDTCFDNKGMNHIFQKLGMRKAGTVRYSDCDKPFPCYEMRLTDACPLLPIRMHPAFRSGSATPWGGTQLKQLYRKNAPDGIVGESLQVSCIPGLESRNDADETLPELIMQYGESLVGKYANHPFPLLLKLIDARDDLSVQVHPNDEYAARHEGGKLGKTQAWLILNANDDSELVYGLEKGVTRSALRDASENGPAVRALLHRQPVRPGDVCYIPSGCVHTIGKGILLYEIQQSSDITYRFYDWDRIDSNGNKRALHLEKALAVADLSFSGEPVHSPADAEFTRILDKPYFTLDIINPQNASVPLPRMESFGILTALYDAMLLTWQSGCLMLQKGETVFLPLSSPEVTVSGSGSAVLAMPKS